MSVTKDMRFALDEKGLKVFAPTLIGKPISYWDNDRQLKHGVVTHADLARDRYGNPFIEVTIDENTAGSDHGVTVPETGAVGEKL
jgi:hypothetical protein